MLYCLKPLLLRAAFSLGFAGIAQAAVPAVHFQNDRKLPLIFAALFMLGLAGAASAGPHLTIDSTIECPDTIVGQTKPCLIDGSTDRVGIWVKNTSTGYFRFQSPVFRENSANAADFETIADASSSQYCYTKYRYSDMPPNARCRLVYVNFQPKSAGLKYLRVQAYIYYNGQNIYTEVLYLQANAGTPGTWQADEFGPCEGGTGQWTTGSWQPSTGCGNTQQTRTLSCAIDANSGSRVRPVRCVDDTGSTQADSFCNLDAKPSTSESCTPEPAICGEAPASSQIVTLDNDCPTGCTPDPDNNKYCVLMPF